MNIPPKYEDVVAQLEAALGREAALTETVALKQRDLIEAQTAVTGWARKHDALQQRLTVAERRTDSLEALLYMSKELITTMSRGGLKPSDWCDSFKSEVADRIEKIGAALKPAAEGEGS